MNIHIKITHNHIGTEIWVDGEKLRGATKVSFVMEVDQPTELVIEGLCMDEKGKFLIQSINGNERIARHRLWLKGGDITIKGVVPGVLQFSGGWDLDVIDTPRTNPEDSL